MIYFCVPTNINIKLIDSTLVEYKLYVPHEVWMNENIYVTTYEDFVDIKKIFSHVQQADFVFRIIEEERFKPYLSFPKKIGVSFKQEYSTIQHFETLLEKQNFVQEYLNHNALSGYLEEEYVAFDTVDFLQQESLVVIIGPCCKFLGEMIAFCSALRIFYHKLKEKCHNVKITLYIQASSNTHYKRDKEIFESYSFIDKVMPLSITIQELCHYDYCVDMSSCEKSIYYDELPYIDFFLRQLGINYQEIDKRFKYNEIHLNQYHVNPKLEEKLESLRQKGKLMLFHPFSAHSSRSIPFEQSKKLIEKLTHCTQEYLLITALKTEGIKNDNLVDLSWYSKTFFDFAYIISQMDAVISVDTATYHISDAFFIPTVVLFNDEKLIQKRVKYYSYVKPLKIKNDSKSYSLFVFKNDALYVNDSQSWNEMNVSEVIKLLEKIR